MSPRPVRASSLLLALVASAAAAQTAAPQAPPAPSNGTPAAPASRPAAAAPRPAAPAQGSAGPFTLAVRREDGFINVALRARRARVDAIARDLAAQLRVPIQVGPALAGEVVTVDQPSAPLEAVLQAIAPRVLVDYELRQAAQPVPLAVYLLAPTDPAPATNVRDLEGGAAHGVVISGHTEETAPDDGKDPVTVSGDARRLSIAATDQPLALVAMVVAGTLGVTLDVEYPAGELVAVEVTDAPAEDAVLNLSPNVRLHLRVDLGAAERTPIKMRLVPPARAAR